MSVKKKKINPALEPKNLIMLAVVGTVVALVAVAMRLVAPTESVKNNLNGTAWEEAVSEASDSLSESASTVEGDSGLTSVYDQEAAPTATDTVPTESATEGNSAKGNDAPQEDNTSSGASFAPPTLGAVTMDYSGDELVFSNTMHDWRTHNGIDFAAEEGTDIFSAADGTVESITDTGMMGATVVILHANDIRTVYSNLSDTFLVNIGDGVKQGSIIGKAGSTAAAEVSEPPHIHFEVIVNGEPVNPHDYMQLNASE